MRASNYRVKRHLLLAAAICAGLLTLSALVFTASAFAKEGIKTFQTTAIETNTNPPPSDLGKVAAAGTVQAEPLAERFDIETNEGATDTVEVSGATTYIDAVVSSPSLSDIAVGDEVTVFGILAGTTVMASHIVISSPLAGGHPNLTTSFSLENPGTPEAAENVIFNAPGGLFGNPYAITHCTSADFGLDQCPSNSQAGLITVYANYKGNPNFLLGTAPLFDVEPLGEETALFAFIVPVLNIPINIPVAVRTGSDYGLRFTVKDITQLTPLASAKLTFWGYPALGGANGHNSERFPKGAPGEPSNCPESTTTACIGAQIPASIPPEPLTDNPTTCTGEPLSTTLEVQTYQDPTHLSRKEGEYPATTACDIEVFTPVLYANPTTTETDSPSGLNIELSAPQFLGFAASPSEIKAATVTLPEGFTINPDAADGQTACTEAEAKFGSEGPAECPDSSKIGTFQVDTEALPAPLTGSVYIGEPKPGEQYRLFEIASGFGINVKLVGSIRPNLVTGQDTAVFSNLPQVPFNEFQLHLFSGERALMATPNRCSIYTTTAEFYPWNGSLAEQESKQVFSLETGPHGTSCPGLTRPFTPTLAAGTTNPAAGAYSSFSLELNREDGEQYLGHLNFTMPPGLTANLHGVGYCPEADILKAAETLGRIEQAEPSCPESSEIGTTNVAAGPGSHPFHAQGKMYLSGPFNGAPLSLAAITPALAGPYDYGTVVVRVAIKIDPLDAHVIADSETVPEIVGGIPLRLRSIQVDINRPNFMINPTNCSEFQTVSEGVGDEGTAVAFSSPFIAVNCGTLPFTPKMTITQVGGRKSTARGKNPGLQFNLDTSPGDANLKSVSVTLPRSFEIDQEHLGNLCDKSELATDQCRGKAAIGTVIDETPLLEKPLQGNAYAVTGLGGGVLPHVVFILGGQVTVMPQGESETINDGELKTTIPVIPDVPIGHFRLSLYGGRLGYLSNTQSLCGHPPVSTVEIEAQNGKSLDQRVKAKTACPAKHKQKRHKAAKHHKRARP